MPLPKLFCYYDTKLCWGYKSQVTKTKFVNITQFWGVIAVFIQQQTLQA